MRSIALIAALVSLVACLSLLAGLTPLDPLPAQAATKTWANPVSGSWTDSTKWNPPGVPAAGDDVFITVDDGTSYTVIVQGAVSINSITLGATGNTGIQTLLIQGVSGTHTNLTVANNLTSAGTITLETGSSTYLSNLTVNGTLISAGTININTGTGGGRNIYGNIESSGTLNVNTDASINKLNGTFTNSGIINIATGKTLTIAGDNQVFNQDGGTLACTGAFKMVSDTFNFNGGTVTGPPVLISSRLNINGSGSGTLSMRGNSTIGGNIAPGQAVLVNGTYADGTATLTASSGFTNAGVITLETIDYTYSSYLTVTSGTLTNAGTININPGTGGSRNLNADLLNNGTININTTTYYNKSTGTLTNAGNLNIASGKTLEFSSDNQVFNQNGGTLAISGTLKLVSDTFNFNGGTVTGIPQLNDSRFNAGAGGTGTVSMRGNSTIGGNILASQTVLVNSAGGTATLTASTDFTNAGIITLETIEGTYSSHLTLTNGILTNNGTINVNAGTGGSRNINANLVNNGTVNINTNTYFNKSTGVLTNNSSFNIASGTTFSYNSDSQVFNQNSGTLAITGTFSMAGDTFNFNGGTVTGTPVLVDTRLAISGTGAGTFSMRGGASTISGNIASSQTVLVNGNYNDYTANLTASSGFTNAGVITLETIDYTYSSYLTVTSGTLTNAGTININPGTGGSPNLNANLDNNGTVNINTSTYYNKSTGTLTNAGNLNIASGKTLEFNSDNQVFNQNGGTLAIVGTLKLAGDTFNLNGGTITGIPQLHDSRFNAGAGGTGTVSMRGNSTIGGNIPASQTVLVNSAGGIATLTASTDFTNAGVITLETIEGTYSSNLTLTNGILTNNGTINVNPGTGSSRNINANLVNNGTVNINTNTYFNKSTGILTNNSSFNIASGTTFSYNSDSQVFNQNGGTLAITGAFSMAGDTFNFNGGTVTGTPVLVDSRLAISGTGAGTFSMRGGASTIAGNIASGQTVLVNGNSNDWSANLTASSGFTNAGTITLETFSGTYASSLTVNGGILANIGTINTNPGTGGGRNIWASFTNSGTVNINADTLFSKASGTYTNTGTINVVSTPTVRKLTVNQGTLIQQSPGSITGGGNIEIASGASFTGVGNAIANINIASGQFNPGASPGIFNITGNYTQTGDGILNIEVGGRDPGTGFDQLNITGTASLAGRVNVTLINSFAPVPCDDFKFLNYGSKSGDFSSTTGIGVDLGGGINFRRWTTASDQTLVAYDSSKKINIYPTSVNISESGTNAPYKLCLTTTPTADVTVTGAPDSQLTVNPTATVFPLASWGAVRSVTVSAVNDGTPEGPHIGVITHTSSSSDGSYNNQTIPSVTASITDNDDVVADFTGTPLSGAAPLNVQFTDQSSNSPTSWSWDFGDGAGSSSQNPAHTYARGGTYNISLFASNGPTSNTRTKNGYIQVIEANFIGSPTSGMKPLTVNFSDQSTGTIATWSWNFGDGTGSSSQNPAKVYNNAGSYNVSVAVTGPAGGSTLSRNAYISVYEYQHTPGFSQVVGADGFVYLNINISRIYNASSGADVQAAGGIGGYDLTLTYPGGTTGNAVNVLAVQGSTPFSLLPETSIQNATGTTRVKASQTGSAPQVPLTLAQVAPKIIGSSAISHNIVLSFNSLVDKAAGSNIPADSSKTFIVRRGDARCDGNITIADALLIAQHLAGLRNIGETTDMVHAINGASVKLESTTTGEKLTIADALLLAQFLAGLRDASYN